MLSIDTIARVVVNASRAASFPSSFDTGLILVKDSNYAAAKRLRKAGIYPVPDPPMPVQTYEEEGNLLRRRTDLEIELRVSDTLVRQNRRPGIAEPPVINILV